MSEYIIYWNGIGIQLTDLLKENVPPYLWSKRIRAERVREPIVRCRDCVHCYEDRRNTAIGWVDIFACDSKQWSTSSLMPSHTIEPDGFCAWGKRKDGGDAE